MDFPTFETCAKWTILILNLISNAHMATLCLDSEFWVFEEGYISVSIKKVELIAIVRDPTPPMKKG